MAMRAWGWGGGDDTAVLVRASSGPGCVCAADTLQHLQPPQQLASPESGLMWNAAISAKTELICAVRELKGKLVILFASLGSKLPLLLRFDFPASDSALPAIHSVSKGFHLAVCLALALPLSSSRS